jgi:hypothetical protein
VLWGLRKDELIVQGLPVSPLSKVSVNGTHSSSIAVMSGILLGSNLGPIHFLLYISDIADMINSLMDLFADDNIILRQIHTQENHTLLQQDTDRVSTRAEQWKIPSMLKIASQKMYGQRLGPANCQPLWLLSYGKDNFYIAIFLQK